MSSRVDGQPLPGGGGTVLRSRLFAFQLAPGIAPDGIAGPLTMKQINRAPGVPEPRLTSGSRPS